MHLNVVMLLNRLILLSLVVVGIEQQDAVALYEFSGRTKRELTFRKGDVIKLTQRRSVDWWDGIIDGKAGLVPDKYIRLTSKKR